MACYETLKILTVVRSNYRNEPVRAYSNGTLTVITGESEPAAVFAKALGTLFPIDLEIDECVFLTSLIGETPSSISSFVKSPALRALTIIGVCRSNDRDNPVDCGGREKLVLVKL